jgi:hypothetical protein
MSVVLVAQSSLPLLELRYVDLALGESFLQDIQRGARGLAGRPEQRMLRAAEPAHRSTTTPTTIARNKINIKKPKNMWNIPPSHIIPGPR